MTGSLVPLDLSTLGGLGDSSSLPICLPAVSRPGGGKGGGAEEGTGCLPPHSMYGQDWTVGRLCDWSGPLLAARVPQGTAGQP